MGAKKNNKRYACESCQEPSKKFAGFADGHDADGNPTHCILYSCDNTKCEHHVNEDRSDIIVVTRAINQKNGIDIKKLRDQIYATHNTMGSVAQLLGVGAAQVSRWLNEYEAMPKDTHDYLSHLLSKS